MVARQNWILRSPLPSRGALRPSVDCRSIACFLTPGLRPSSTPSLQRVRHFAGLRSNGACRIPRPTRAARWRAPSRPVGCRPHPFFGQSDFVICLGRLHGRYARRGQREPWRLTSATTATCSTRQVAGYVAAEFASFSSLSFTFGKSASAYVTPWPATTPARLSYAVPSYSRSATASFLPSLKTF